ncbi:MAG: DUF1858 domain-containing protein [Calditrichaeota bacterium]|nr:MAG: DUF1858 domain-containing protein [Calditrichota bacterium]
MNQLEINKYTKLGELFKAFPQTEETLKSLSPLYKNLENPILRKTVMKIATLEKVARVGGLNVYDVVNVLRQNVGQPPLQPEEETTVETNEDVPDWASGKPELVVDGVEMLNRGEHPLGLVMQTMQRLEAGKFILLKTNFEPAPLIEKMTNAGYKVHHTVNKTNPQERFTYIGK